MNKIIVFALSITAFFNASAIPNLVRTQSAPARDKTVVIDAAMFNAHLKVAGDTTVRAVKQHIERKKGITVREQVLYVRTRDEIVILKNNQKLGSLNLRDGATVKLFRKRSRKAPL